jgi:hypothetical protein
MAQNKTFVNEIKEEKVKYIWWKIERNENNSSFAIVLFIVFSFYLALFSC